MVLLHLNFTFVHAENLGTRYTLLLSFLTTTLRVVNFWLHLSHTVLSVIVTITLLTSLLYFCVLLLVLDLARNETRYYYMMNYNGGGGVLWGKLRVAHLFKQYPTFY